MAHYFERTWRNKHLTADAATIDGMIRRFREPADERCAMKATGVSPAEGCNLEDDDALLITDDPQVAKRFGLERMK